MASAARSQREKLSTAGDAPVAQHFLNAVVPGAPTIGTATAGDTEATVTFTPPHPKLRPHAITIIVCPVQQ